MSKSNNKIFKYVNKSPKKKQPLSELILTTLNDVELRTKSMKIKEIKIKENIRSIKLKEKKYNKINEEITTRKQELKLLKELLFFKEQKNIDLYTLLCGYDLNEDGVLEKNELKFALDKISQLNNNQFEALINLFNLGDKINIKDFISLFNMEFVNKLSF